MKTLTERKETTVEIDLPPKTGVMEFTLFLAKELIARAAVAQEEDVHLYAVWDRGRPILARVTTPTDDTEMLRLSFYKYPQRRAAPNAYQRSFQHTHLLHCVRRKNPLNIMEIQKEIAQCLAKLIRINDPPTLTFQDFEIHPSTPTAFYKPPARLS